MAGLMAIIMKEIAIMEAEANPDDDSDTKSVVENKVESCDNLEILDEYAGEIYNIQSKMYKLNSNNYRKFKRHPELIYPVKRRTIKDGR